MFHWVDDGVCSSSLLTDMNKKWTNRIETCSNFHLKFGTARWLCFINGFSQMYIGLVDFELLLLLLFNWTFIEARVEEKMKQSHTYTKSQVHLSCQKGEHLTMCCILIAWTYQSVFCIVDTICYHACMIWFSHTSMPHYMSVVASLLLLLHKHVLHCYVFVLQCVFHCRFL